ncbi:MAG: hypothetical protein ABW321_07505, partial [Polyangiales bacterium]
MRRLVVCAAILTLAFTASWARAHGADEACAHFGAVTTSFTANQATLINALESSLTGATVNLSTGQLGALGSAKVSLKN